MTHPSPGDGGDGGDGEVETKSPPGSRPSPPLAPRDKISRSGSPHSDKALPIQDFGGRGGGSMG